MMDNTFNCSLMISDLREALESYNHTVNGNLTFHGVLHQYFDEIAKTSYWKQETTLKQYQNEYKNFILKKISFSIPLCELSKEYFDVIIEEIKADYLEDKGKTLSSERIQHFRRLISRVVKVAAEHKMCDDFFWGTVFNVPENEEKKKDKETTALRTLLKSLAPNEEIKIYREIMSDPTAPGQTVGLALMLCTGVRNEEACGLNFEDICEMKEHPGNYCIRIYKSTEAKTNKLQAGGKTKNAPRMIPIPDQLALLLSKRREYILSKLSGEAEAVDIDLLPIACRKDDYRTRCFANDLSLAGRLLFKKIRLNERLLQNIEEEIDDAISGGIEEGQELPVKDATTYLFRRNMATHMYILGLSEPQIKYIMGHAIEDDYETRNSFCNEDNLYRIKEMLEKRPLVSSCALDIQRPIDIGAGYMQTGQTHNISFRAQGQVRLSVTANEPDDPVRIHIRSEDGTVVPMQAFVSRAVGNDNLRRTIDVTAIYQKVYRQKLNSSGIDSEIDENHNK